MTLGGAPAIFNRRHTGDPELPEIHSAKRRLAQFAADPPNHLIDSTLSLQRPLLIQAHWSDFDSFRDLIEHPQLGLAARAKSNFDDIVLVTGEDGRNSCVHEFARKIGIQSFAGDDVNVGLRFRQCMQHFGYSQAARALAHHFAVDFTTVQRCFDLLESEASQYVVLPTDFDLRFACDVFSSSFLDTAEQITESNGSLAPDNFAAEAPAACNSIRSSPGRLRRLRHTPWASVDVDPSRFELSYLREPLILGPNTYAQVRSHTNALYPERSRKQAIPLHGYEQALELLPAKSERVLDIACGWGDGSALLAQHFPNVTGADYDGDQIASNRAAHPNASFCRGDASDADLFPTHSFNAIVSIHSMEHFQRDDLFLDACRRWLRPNGYFVLEVPLIMTYPFPHTDEPLGEGHVREYTVDGLRELVQQRFDIVLELGVSRGLYVDVSRARNAIMMLLRPSDSK